MWNKSGYLAVLIVVMVTAPAAADVKMPAVISDNMVLQQNSEANLWGWADPGEVITVKASWSKECVKTVTADNDGKWKLSIRTPKAGGPYTLTIEAKNIISIQNILIGEVWVCSGQSNMEMGMAWVHNAADEIAKANYPTIRLFNVKDEAAILPADGPADDLTGNWAECTPRTIRKHGPWGGFSATAYYFGRKLSRELKVPIGLIDADWGGTSAKVWTSGDMLLTMPEFADRVERLRNGKEKMLDRQKHQAALLQYEKAVVKWKARIQDVESGAKEKWFKVKLDESKWKEAKALTTFEEAGIRQFDGIVWFRKTVEINDDLAGRDAVLSLGKIDDSDVVYFNGEKIGETNGWSQERHYKVSGQQLKAGKNTIAVRVRDTGGDGGFSGTAEQMCLQVGEARLSLAEQWLYRISADKKDIPPEPSRPVAVHHGVPSSLFNGMISPLIPFTIQGAIWYQGEADVSRPGQYQTLFPAMIKSWRDAWGLGDFPFYYVQLAPFNYANNVNSAFLREAQFMTMSMPNVGMAVTMDIGAISNIHPGNKLDVGERLARWALAKCYGQDRLVYSGPIYKGMAIEGNRIRLSFDCVGSGLMARNGPLSHFQIAGANKNFVDAHAVIDRDTVIVRADEVLEPVAVRFAFTNTAEPNLYNKEGLPASSFRTDRW